MVCRGRPDRGESAAEVRDPPLVAVTAAGTVVVPPALVSRYAVCADVGSTWTKVAVVGLHDGRLVATAATPTTTGTDVLHGLDAAVAAATAGLGAAATRAPYVCSSAGGGLRLAVVGYERLVTAQAGERVGLSAGARVVRVDAGRLDGAGVRRCAPPGRTWCCWSAAPTAGTPRRSRTTPAGWPAPAGGCRWCWPATPT